MITDDDADRIARAMSTTERAVILLCSLEKSWGYSRLAEKAGLDFYDLRMAGKSLQLSNLADVRPVRHGREFAGSAIFLNRRGEKVRSAVERMQSVLK